MTQPGNGKVQIGIERACRVEAASPSAYLSIGVAVGTGVAAGVASPW